MAAQGWIKLHRSLMDWKHWREEPFNKGQAWVDLLLMASHKDTKFVLGMHSVETKRGQFITSMAKLSSRWRWGDHKVKRFLNMLKNDEDIDVQTTNHFTKITICNYNKYQTTIEDNDEQTTSKVTSDRRAIDERSTTIKNVKNEKKVNNISINGTGTPEPSEDKKQLGSSPVYMTQDEIQKLAEKTNSPEEAKYWIARLTDYARDNPKKFSKYKSHYRTVLDWRRREMSRARQFYNHPTTGWNYYPNYEIERLSRSEA